MKTNKFYFGVFTMFVFFCLFFFFFFGIARAQSKESYLRSAHTYTADYTGNLESNLQPIV